MLAALVALAACSDAPERPGASTSDPARSALRFVAVTHGVSANPFWSVVINGLDDAGRDMGVRVEYQAPNTFDMVTMSELIDAAVAVGRCRHQPFGRAAPRPEFHLEASGRSASSRIEHMRRQASQTEPSRSLPGRVSNRGLQGRIPAVNYSYKQRDGGKRDRHADRL